MLALLLATALLPLAVTASEAATRRDASIVIDFDSGEVLHERHADARRYPASLTKMMTLYMVFDKLNEGKLRLDQPLKVSRRAAAQPPSKLGLRPGTTVRVEDAILALVTKSANDVAVVIAEAVGGSEKTFGTMMTKRARALGMTGTTFRNASGLPNRGQVSTARDMAKLARALIRDHGRYYHYFSTREFDHGGATYTNHNRLLRGYDGADGIKTGYIGASGFNLVASAKRNGRRLIGVVFGGRNAASRDKYMVKLLDAGFARAGTMMAAAEQAEDEAAAVAAATGQGAEAVSGSGDAEEVNWGLQVGAFSRQGPAYSAIKAARRTLPDLLGGIRTVVVPVRVGNRTLYRARFVGVSEDQARSACGRLKRVKWTCQVVDLGAAT